MAVATNPYKFQKYLVWMLSCLPAMLILLRYLTDEISYGQVIHETGDWSVVFLGATLAVTPFRRVFPSARWLRWLMRHRRALGVASFGYAAFHTLAYLERKWGYGYILKEAGEPGIFTGWIALALFLLLALTSNNASVRFLKRGWQRLHRLVYPAAALVFVHWVLTAFEPLTAYIWLSIFVAIFALRWLPRKVAIRS